MSKTIKLTDEIYIDSSSISHNEKTLTNILNGNILSTDFNTAHETGIYYINKQSCKNIPSNIYAEWGVLLVLKSLYYNSIYIAQIYIGNFGAKGGRVAIRSGVNENSSLQNINWTDWIYY